MLRQVAPFFSSFLSFCLTWDRGFESIAFLIAGIVVAVAIDFEEFWWTMFAGFYLAAFIFMIHNTIATLIYSYAEIVEHTKKQTELLKVVAMK